MKHVSKLPGLVLVAAALLLSSCAKKPVRVATPMDTQTGPSNPNINPDSIAVAPDSTLMPRGPETGPVDENKSVVDSVYFALDRYAVSQAERPKLDAALKWLKDNPEKSLVLVGRCDWRGTAEYNLGLGDHRATSVKRYLESLGADPARLETLSKGSTDAKQAGGEGDWQKDRRVDFVELVKKQ